MNQIIEQSDEEKMKMYMKLSKVEIIKMLIESNKHLNRVLENNKTQQFQSFPSISTYPNISTSTPCQHDNCMKCKGSGIDTYGNACFHSLYCGCPKCTPTF